MTALEFDLNHFKTETIKAYGEMAMELVMVKGLCEDAVKRLASMRRSTEERFAQVRQDISEVKQDGNDHTIRLERMETMLIQILERLPEKP